MKSRRNAVPKFAVALVGATCMFGAAAAVADTTLLTQVKPISGESIAGAGFVTYDITGDDGHTYEVSTDQYFRKYKSWQVGDRVSTRVAINGLKKKKVGHTAIYVRDAADRYNSVESADMAWDFSVPYITWGKTKTVLAADGHTPLLGHWQVQTQIRDTAAPGDERGIWLQLNYDKAAPAADAFPTETATNSVIEIGTPGALTSVSVSHATPPYWARVQDAYGNVGKWVKLARISGGTYKKN